MLSEKRISPCVPQILKLSGTIWQDFTLRAIEDRSLYRRGFLVCGALLKSFGLPGGKPGV